MYVSPTSTRLFRGMLTPAMRATTYPCRCLCRGFWQITSTRPWRRMILHFSHIGLTDGRTFMVPFGSMTRTGRLWKPARPPLPSPGNGGGTPEPRGSRARPSRIAKGFVRSRRRLAAVSVALVALSGASSAQADPLADHAPVLVHDSDERNPLASVARAGVAGRSPRVYGRAAGPWLQYWLFYPQNTQD